MMIFFFPLPGDSIIPLRAWLYFTIIDLCSERQGIKIIQRKLLKILISQASNGQWPSLNDLSYILSDNTKAHSVLNGSHILFCKLGHWITQKIPLC